MKQFTNVIICLDDTDRDAPMMAYMAPFLEKAQTRNVYLLHVHDPEHDPHSTSIIPCSDSMVLVPVTPNADITERTRDGMYALAQQYLKPIAGMSWRVILSGEPEITEILSQAAGLDADLIVIGRHYGDAQFKSGRAVTARRITEKSTCSVLVLPESATPQISNIVVPVRNSKCSATALKTADGIATAFDARVTALNVFRTVASGNIDKTRTRIEQLARAADAENHLLLKHVSIDSTHLSSKCLPCDDNDPVATILSEMMRIQCDLVAIGARGRTGAAGILLGAVTEELIQQSPVPVLAIKNKGECVDLLHALLSLVKQNT